MADALGMEDDQSVNGEQWLDSESASILSEPRQSEWTSNYSPSGQSASDNSSSNNSASGDSTTNNDDQLVASPEDFHLDPRVPQHSLRIDDVLRHLIAPYIHRQNVTNRGTSSQDIASTHHRANAICGNKARTRINKIGRRLMSTGGFGVDNTRRLPYDRAIAGKFALQILYRELGSSGTQSPTSSGIAQTLIPVSRASKTVYFPTACYSGQFSDDGNFFFLCSKDFKVRLYDTSNALKWRHIKTAVYPRGSWTLTDATLSSDNRFLAYSSLRNVVCLTSTEPTSDSDLIMLDLSTKIDRQIEQMHRRDINQFEVWSLRFSGDGRELVAGTSAPSVCVYDIESRQTVVDIHNAHSKDVNAVCYGDKSSPHILYSGSDDALLKVWDRRSLRDGRPSGVLIGHTEGLTFVDSKGDGRYVLSNGKDQTMKLWDLRSMATSERCATIKHQKYSTGFDYRYMDYPFSEARPHPNDCSLVTFRGHQVLKTLIRCHFSPPTSTNSRYLYSGSADGDVYIWNLDSTLAGKISGDRVFSRSSDSSARNDDHEFWPSCVRDVSWHPNAPVIAASSWNGGTRAGGMCTIHEWSYSYKDMGESHMSYPSTGTEQQADIKSRPVATRYEDGEVHTPW